MEGAWGYHYILYLIPTDYLSVADIAQRLGLPIQLVAEILDR
ncbi:MAG: hypothetical protein ACFCU9_08540 [Cyanophyceae cyanobacterium]